MKLEELSKYQKIANKTVVYKEEDNVVYPVLKLNGEAGEVSEKVGKVFRDNNGIFTNEIKKGILKELGDTLWYCAAIARDLGFDLGNLETRHLSANMETAAFPIVKAVLRLEYFCGMIANRTASCIAGGMVHFDEDYKKYVVDKLSNVILHLGAIAYKLGYTFDDVMSDNLGKVLSRASNNTIHGSGDNR